jgi:two-component system cell cycle response regulator
VDRDDHEIEILRRRLAELTLEARKNDEAWRRSQRREMELLEADGLGALFSRLTTGLRDSYRLATATLVVADPDHEIQRLLTAQDPASAAIDNVLFVDTVHGLAPQLAAGRAPWLGRYNVADHGLLFQPRPALESVALLPLTRQDRLIGSLNFGSEERGRFGAALGTEFLQRLAVIAAFCLESAVNRARLVRSGFTDELTGWHNRRYLLARLHEELARCARDRASLTCLMVDVDHFKSINDRYGHLAGDEVLRQLAHCINGEVRGSDVSARYGGEEFVILLPATPLAAGYLLAERIRAAVADERFATDDEAGSIGVTVSIGVAEHVPDDSARDLKVAAERLLARADVALYEAKAGGRNTVARAANS